MRPNTASTACSANWRSAASWASVAGVAFGQCTNCANPGDGYGNFTIYEVLEQHFGTLGVPAFQGAAIGHIAGQQSMPVGIEAEIDAATGTIRILEPLVR